jgi:putative DNA primase/helicase
LRWPGGSNENQTTSSQPFIVAPQHNCKPKDDAAPATFSAAPHFVGEPTIAEVVEDLGFELIFDAAEMIESFAISLREASFRRDRGGVPAPSAPSPRAQRSHPDPKRDERPRDRCAMTYDHFDQFVEEEAKKNAAKRAAHERNGVKARAPGEGDPLDLADLQARTGTATGASVRATPAKRIKVTMGSDITPEPIKWAWRDWLAFGKLHINAGRPGSLKTTSAMDWAATFTIGGKWLDGSPAPQGRALVWSGEDAINDTLLPRILGAGGNRAEIGFISGVEEDGKKRPFDPARDMDSVAAACASIGGVKFVVIDPVVSTSKGDSHKNAETRRDLQPLVELGEQTQAVILGIHHLTKRSEKGDPVDRVFGSLAYGAAPRMVLLSAIGPAQAEPHGVVMRAKGNIAPQRGGFAFKAEMRPLVDYPNISAPRILWGDYLDEPARDILTKLEGGQTETVKRKATCSCARRSRTARRWPVK